MNSSPTNEKKEHGSRARQPDPLSRRDFFKTALKGAAGVAILGLYPKALAFYSGPEKPIHENITKIALSFLKPDILADIVEEQYDVDYWTQLTPTWHFDSGWIRDTIQRINNQYDYAVDATVNFAGGYGVVDYFGELLHPVQDFYSHTNWVELLAAGLVKGPLFDTGFGKWWKPEKDWQQHPTEKDLIVAEGHEETLPAGWSAKKDPVRDRIMLIATDSSGTTTKYGLTSGYFSGLFGDPDISPPVIEPDNLHRGANWTHNYLNKDLSNRPFFNEAADLAIRQTTHEWDRLLSLGKAKWTRGDYDTFLEESVNYRTEIFVDGAKFNFPDDLSKPEETAEGNDNPSKYVAPDGSADNPYPNLDLALRCVRPGSKATVFISQGTYYYDRRITDKMKLVKNGNGEVKIKFGPATYV